RCHCACAPPRTERRISKQQQARRHGGRVDALHPAPVLQKSIFARRPNWRGAPKMMPPLAELASWTCAAMYVLSNRLFAKASSRKRSEGAIVTRRSHKERDGTRVAVYRNGVESCAHT